MAENESPRRQRLFQRLKAFISLNIENARLTVAEKLILLLTAILITAICLILGGIALLFITVAIAHIISFWLPVWAAYSIMAAVNIIIILTILILRRPLIINPISRAISRIILS
ncbi:MAG: hypothetical protein NC342_07960 [Pseudoflavonifractor sp.]|nr:hypothetical protein [Alloprevotella sp.]MCM1117455.1 hypothetical protein [Pseudoflavonifractor sp.]